MFAGGAERARWLTEATGGMQCVHCSRCRACTLDFRKMPEATSPVMMPSKKNARLRLLDEGGTIKAALFASRPSLDGCCCLLCMGRLSSAMIVCATWRFGLSLIRMESR